MDIKKNSWEVIIMNTFLKILLLVFVESIFIKQMKIAFFSAKEYDKKFFTKTLKQYPESTQRTIQIEYFSENLSPSTLKLAFGFDSVCIFVNDSLSNNDIKLLKEQGLKLVLLRCAGFNNVCFKTAKSLDIPVLRVPSYSPFSVAEHTMALLLSLVRKTHLAYNRTRAFNFALDGLLGFDLNGRTVGVLGTGKIGFLFAKICKGFGMKVIGFDPYKNESFEKELGGEYKSLEDVLKEADVISLHMPLMEKTKHIINKEKFAIMKDNVILLNAARGGLVKTEDLIEAIKEGKVGGAGLDVYENESDLFFSDKSMGVMKDDVLARLVSFNNVIITGHQAFFTEEALESIAKTTINNAIEFEEKKECKNCVYIK